MKVKHTSLYVAMFYSDPVTEIIYTYTCITCKCEVKEDQFSESVRAALQTMHLLQYQGEVKSRREIASNYKVYVNCNSFLPLWHLRC
jgi:hypothetical protein